jgi:hypothetical protein
MTALHDFMSPAMEMALFVWNFIVEHFEKPRSVVDQWKAAKPAFGGSAARRKII